MPAANATACLSCPLMVLYWNVTGAANASQVCTGCEPGWFLNGFGVCQSCQPGAYSVNLSQPACTPCGPGRFSVIPGAATGAVCQPCAPGAYQSGLGATVCASCLPGMFQGSPGGTVCALCAPGSVGNGSGASACLVCTPGGYMALYGWQGGCTLCEPGTYGVASGASSASVCQDCPNATANPAYGAANASACQPCASGYTTDLVSCQACPAGTYFEDNACEPCEPGSYTSAPAQTMCSACPPGTAQALQGGSGCAECGDNQFSSEGDTLCARCGAATAPLGQQCTAPGWPDATPATWVAVQGPSGAQDLCLGVGMPSVASQVVTQAVFTYGTQAACATTLYLQGHPELTQQWPGAVSDYRRPVGVQVYRYNLTFYQDLCAAKGISVVFTLQDARGETQVDTTDMQAILTLIREDNEQAAYGSTVCNALPGMQDPVPYGYCYTSVCPDVEVIAQVTVSWPTGGVVGHTLLYSAGPPGYPPQPRGWLLDFELADAGVPYMPGDTLTVYVTSPEAPWTVDSFQFAADVGPYAVLSGFTSDFQITGGQQGGVLSMLGVDGPAGLNATLVTLTFTVLPAAQGVQAVFTVRPGSQVAVTTSYVPLVGSRNCRGYSLDTTGVLRALFDQPTVTQLFARGTRLWLSRMQAFYPLPVHANAMYNTMGKILTGVQAACGATTLVVLQSGSPCSSLAPGLQPGTAYVQVSYGSAIFQLAVAVAQPAATTVWVSATSAAIGQSLPYKVFATLTGLSVDIPAADVTGLVSVTLGGGLATASQQLQCLSLGQFTVVAGSASATVTCVQNKTVASAAIVAFGTGLPAVGSYQYAPAQLSPSSPSALGFTLVAYTDASTLLVAGLASADPARMQASGTGLTLVQSGLSSRCVTVLGVQGAAASVPVLQPTPVSLTFTLASAGLVVSTNTDDVLPTSTTVATDSLLLSDGAVVSPPLQLASSQLSVVGGTVYAPAQPTTGVVTASVSGMPCVQAQAVVHVYTSAVLAVTLACPGCPTLTVPTDPLSQLFPGRFPSSLAAAGFVLTATLGTGEITTLQAPLVITGAARLAGGTVYAESAGAFQVSMLVRSVY